MLSISGGITTLLTSSVFNGNYYEDDSRQINKGDPVTEEDIITHSYFDTSFTCKQGDKLIKCSIRLKK